MPSAAAMDAIVVGRETAARDDPLLTARPAGPRTAMRVVLDTRAALAVGKPLGPHAPAEAPVLVAVGSEAAAADCRRLPPVPAAKCWSVRATTHAARLDALLGELGRRRMTNVLVEGGGRVLGSLLDARQIDEVHVFIAPKLVGGAAAPSSGRRPGRRRIGRRAGFRRRCSSSRSAATCMCGGGGGIRDWGLGIRKAPGLYRGHSKDEG